MNLVQTRKKPQLFILFFLISFMNILALLYSAALPDLTKYFQITKDQAQQTIAFFLLGFSFGLLFYGPLSNALGRKPAIYIGGSVAILGSLVCIFAIEMHSFSLLLFGRVLAAFGTSCGLSLTYILIADSFIHVEAKKKFSYLIGGLAVFQSISISLGGFLTEYISWQSCFYFMLFYSFFVIGLCIFLPETVTERHLKHLRLTTIAKSYFKQSRNLLFILCTLMLSAGAIILFLFSTEASFIAINEMKISPALFGIYNLIPYVGLFIGGFASAHFSPKFSSKKMIMLASLVFLISSATMLVCFTLGFVNIFTLFVLPAFVFFTVPALISNASALALTVSKDHGYASSLMTSMQFFLIFLCIYSLNLFPSQADLVLPLICTASGALMIIIWLFMRNLKVEHTR